MPSTLAFQKLFEKVQQDEKFSQLEEETQLKLRSFVAQLPRINADILHRPLAKDVLIGARIRFLTFARKHNLANALSESKFFYKQNFYCPKNH